MMKYDKNINVDMENRQIEMFLMVLHYSTQNMINYLKLHVCVCMCE